MQIIPIHIEKEIVPSDDISDLILKSEKINSGDIIVIAQKIISKQEGRLIKLSNVTPSLLAEGISSQYQKDPRIMELILSESKRIIRMGHGILIVETNNGFICANAGIDESNVEQGYATLLPLDSDISAQNIRNKILEQTQKHTAVIISDTFGRPFRRRCRRRPPAREACGRRSGGGRGRGRGSTSRRPSARRRCWTGRASGSGRPGARPPRSPGP